MRLSAEQVLQDNNRFANCNAIAELKYCGWEIPQRRAITNDEIRFYAWLCRSAVDLLKERDELLHKKQKDIDRLCNEISEWKHKFHDKSLKEQEPIPAKIDGVSAGVKYGSCPNCGEGLNSEVYPHWCGFCGQAVTWDG